MQASLTLPLTVDQINAILMEQRIFCIHSILSSGTIIVVCDDDLLRAIKFQGSKLIWLDS